MLALVDALTPTPNSVFGLDGDGNPEMIARSALPTSVSPAFTGVPTAPTAPTSTNTQQIATTAFVKAVVAALIASAPGALDTLDELAAALGDDPNFAATLSSALALRLRVDAAQGLSQAQQQAAAANLAMAFAHGGVKFNGKIVESRTGGAATFAVKTIAGADPSAAMPVRFSFTDGAGGFADVDVTAALSIAVPSGATLGATNGVAFRVWIAAFNDSGTVRLAVYNAATGRNVKSPLETKVASSTLTPANSAQVFYTTGGAVTSKYWNWIAYATYESGLATAGTWNVAPSDVVLVRESTPRPGTAIQRVNDSAMVTANANVLVGLAAVIKSLSITPQSAANLVAVSVDNGKIYPRPTAGALAGYLDIYRGGSSILSLTPQAYCSTTAEIIVPVALTAIDAIRSNALLTYEARAYVNSTAQNGVDVFVGSMTLIEYMG